MNQIQKPYASMHVTVLRDVYMSHRRRLLFNHGMRLVEGMPATIRYEKGRSIKFWVVPIPGEKANVFVDPEGWAIEGTEMQKQYQANAFVSARRRT